MTRDRGLRWSAFPLGRLEGMESRPICAAMTMGVYVQEIPESVIVAVEALDKMLFEQKPAGDGRAN